MATNWHFHYYNIYSNHSVNDEVVIHDGHKFNNNNFGKF